jgi:hypothetical protein
MRDQGTSSFQHKANFRTIIPLSSRPSPYPPNSCTGLPVPTTLSLMPDASSLTVGEYGGILVLKSGLPEPELICGDPWAANLSKYNVRSVGISGCAGGWLPYAYPGCMGG